MSRTLSGIRQLEADQIAKVLQQITQPILAEEVMQALKRSGRWVYDGDLTDWPVSNTSTGYPGVAYGHMGDGLHLGYQAAMVSRGAGSFLVGKSCLVLPRKSAVVIGSDQPSRTAFSGSR